MQNPNRRENDELHPYDQADSTPAADGPTSATLLQVLASTKLRKARSVIFFPFLLMEGLKVLACQRKHAPACPTRLPAHFKPPQTMDCLQPENKAHARSSAHHHSSYACHRQ